MRGKLGLSAVVGTILAVTASWSATGGAAPVDPSAAAVTSTAGEVVGWGSDNAQTVDVPKFLTGVTQLDADFYAVVALKSDGTVVMW